jgi:hypothetical protein
MRSMLDSWARAHKRQRLKELRAKQPKSVADAINSYVCNQLREEGLERIVFPPEPFK